MVPFGIQTNYTLPAYVDLENMNDTQYFYYMLNNASLPSFISTNGSTMSIYPKGIADISTF